MVEQGLPSEVGEPRVLTERATVSALYRLACELPLEQPDAFRIASILRGRGLVPLFASRPLGEAREEVGVSLARYWAEGSPYIAERTAIGHRIGKRHTYEMSRKVALFWEPCIETRDLSDESGSPVLIPPREPAPAHRA